MDQHFCCFTVPLKVCAKVLRNGWGFEWLCTVWYPGEIDRDSPTRFFSTFEPAWATDHWVTIFSIFVKISPSYSIFRILPGVTYCTESLMTPACVCTPQRTQPDWAWEKGGGNGGSGVNLPKQLKPFRDSLSIHHVLYLWYCNPLAQIHIII